MGYQPQWGYAFNVSPLLPGLPQNLQATTIDADEIDLNWDDLSGATGYNIYRDGVLIDTSATSAYANTGLDPDTTYSYQVSATNAQGEGRLTAIVQATTAP